MLLENLFPDGDYSSILNDFHHFGDTIDLNCNNSSSFLPPLPSVNNDGMHLETINTNGNTSSELFRFLPDEQRNTLAIVDDR
ncbi:unnamed protein product, partial [Rotaria sp. Silwood1]